MKYLGNRSTDLRQIHKDNVFDSLVPRSDEFEGQGQRSRSPGTKTAFFGPFGGLRVVYVR